MRENKKSDLIKYGLKYGVYSLGDVVKTVIWRLLPNSIKRYPIYSIYRMEKQYYNYEENCFDFNGIKIPKMSVEYLLCLGTIYIDIFHIFCRLEDNYAAINYGEYDKMCEGPYPYVDNGEIYGIDKGDVVIDAGAWIGDFAAYASKKGASKVYAFEPQSENYEYLQKTARLNSNIVAVKKGLGDTEEKAFLSGDNEMAKIAEIGEEIIETTTIDNFVEEYKIKKVDFIKADIEGFERKMLVGAINTLKNFAPKISICTYHLPDDPSVLEKIICDANPSYKVIQRKNKLFAYVMK